MSRMEGTRSRELVLLQAKAIDAVAVPVVKATEEVERFNVPEFVSSVTGVHISHVRTRLDHITGWRGDTPEWLGHDRLLWVANAITQKLVVNEGYPGAVDLLKAEAIPLGNGELPMADLREMVTEQVQVNDLAYAALSRQAGYANWPAPGLTL